MDQFEHFHEQSKVFTCDLYIEVDDRGERRQIKAPRFVIEDEFLQLVEQASHIDNDVRIRLTRQVPIFDEFQDRWVNKQHEIVFANNAWVKNRGDKL